MKKILPRVMSVSLSLLIIRGIPVQAAPDDDTDWAPYVAPPTKGTVATQTTDAGAFGSPDRFGFDQQLRSHLMDQICRNLNLQHGFNVGGADFSGTSFRMSRALGTYPDNTLAVIDDENVVVSWNRVLSHAMSASGAETKNISFNALVQGDSMVIRPLGPDMKTCDQVGRIFNFRDIKTVFPLRGDRISKMELGELWRVPLTLTYTEGASVNDPDASLSFTRSDSGLSSMTLYRVADNQVRMRFHIDHVVVYSRSLGITKIYPAVTFVANAKNILLRMLESQVSSQFENYTLSWLTFTRSTSHGAKIMMEFVVDPRDPAQADAMASAMKGDFRELAAMAGRMSTFNADDDAAIKTYTSLRDANAKIVGDSTYSASDKYKSKTDAFSLNVPLFIASNVSSLFGDDLIKDTKGEFHFYAGDKSKSNQYWNILPVLGPLIKTNSQRDVKVVTHGDPGQPQGNPIIVYSRNQGYFRRPASEARAAISDMNGFLNLVGAQRGIVNPKTNLPIDSFVPPTPMMAREPSVNGSLFFTLVFNQKAVSDMIAATDSAVRLAVVAAVGPGERPFVNWIKAHGKLQNGAFPEDADDHSTPGGELEKLSRETTGLLADLASARNAKTNEDRAQVVAQIISGEGKSGLAYEDVIRVLVQLIDPMDLTGDFVSSLNLKTATPHLFLKGREKVPTLKAAGDVQARFAQPSPLID